MRYRSLPDGDQIPVIGLDTRRMGGGSEPDPSQDEQVLDVLHMALELGYTHIDTAEMYGGGHTEELIGQVIRDFDRKTLFITSKVWHTNLRQNLEALDFILGEAELARLNQLAESGKGESAQ